MPIKLRKHYEIVTGIFHRPSKLLPQTGPTQLKAVDEPEAYASIIDLTEE